MTTPCNQINSIEIESVGQITSAEVEAASQILVSEVLIPGIQGPAGGAAFIFTQPTPSTTWIINHNLGFRPTVELLDSGGQEIDAEVSHPTINQTIATLSPATAGSARLI